MLSKLTVLTLSSLALLPFPSLAALQCAPGQTHVNVSGTVTTLNVSDTRQAGQVCLTLTRTADGRETFNDCGALLGKIVAADQTGGSTLAHTAVFDLRNAFVTRNDQAQITGVLAVDETSGTPCAFSAVETISEIEKGTGLFRDGKIAVTAQGSVSFCPSNNLNTFTLQGEACVRK
jgi:hypothetical protein